MNLVGEQATYEINLGDYIESYKAEDQQVKVTMSKMKIEGTGNMLTSAPKSVDMKEECQCIEGGVGNVDKIDLVFDYIFE